MELRSDDESAEAAFAIAYAAFRAARREELRATLGYTPDPADHQSTARPDSVESVESDDQRLRSFTDVPLPYDVMLADGLSEALPYDVTLADGLSEAQLGVDQAAVVAALETAQRYGVTLFGEEDTYRGQEEAPRKRADAALATMNSHAAFAINDPVDGSNQLAGMGNRSGWCAATLVKVDGQPANVCIINGDGRAWLTENLGGDDCVLYNELDPVVSPAVERYRAGWTRIPHEWTPRSIFTQRLHYIIPAASRNTLLGVAEMMRHYPAVSHIAPLAGNPGLMAGLFCAGAAGGYQPASWPWDQLWALPAAIQHLTILASEDDNPLMPEDVQAMLIGSLLRAEKVPPLYVGKTHAVAYDVRDLVRSFTG